MLLSDLYKSTKSPLSRLRHHPGSHHGPQDPEYSHADLISKDKVRQKEAVKRYLADRIRNDWVFKWPPSTADEAGEEREAVHDSAIADSSDDDDGGHVDDENDSDSLSNYSSVSEDLEHFRPRDEWLSDLSEDERARTKVSAYRFSSPDAVGAALEASELERSARRRKAARDEMKWNTGLACFSARRDAWTGAKTVRVRSPKPPTPPPQSATSPPASKRLSWFRLSSSAPSTPLSDTATSVGGGPVSPTATRASGDTTIAVSSSSASDGESKLKDGLNKSMRRIETLLPVPPPLLPPANPMRSSITPATYPSIYDRIVVHSMTPACPINLQDVIRSCVAGWKRDGEWPPRGSAAQVAPVVAIKNKRRPKQPSSGGTAKAKVDAKASANANARPKTRKESNASRNSSGAGTNKDSGSNKASRRLSLGFLGKKDPTTTIGTLEAAQGVGAGHGLGAGNVGGGGGGGGGRAGRRSHGEETIRGLRKSFQRVLGLGHDKAAGSPGGLG